jgi:hypothetical protein
MKNILIGQDKLIVARKIILDNLLPKIKDEYIDDDRPFLKIVFFNGLILYIRYNDHYEYSYQLVYSQKPLDRIRYDNYEDMWNVISKPHHLHPKGEKIAIKSSMTGDPKYDIPTLLKKHLDFF